MTTVDAARCIATKPRLDGGMKQCPKRATHGEWCRMHAQSLGGWVLVPPEWFNPRVQAYTDRPPR